MKKYILIFIVIIMTVFALTMVVSANQYEDENGMIWTYSVNADGKTASIVIGTVIPEGMDRSVEINIPSVVYDGQKEYTITKIGTDAFRCGSNYNSKDYLTKQYFGHLTIPNTVTEIGSYAFAYSAIYGDVVIPDSVVSIGEGAFYGCESLETITISESLIKSIVTAFDGCPKLKIIRK